MGVEEGDVGSTEPSGVKVGDYELCVKAGGAVLGEDYSTPVGQEVEAGERSVTGLIVKAGGVMSWQ